MHLSGKSIDDELYVLCRDSLDSLLNNMVAILILDAFQHMVFQLFYEQRLLVCKDMFQSLFSQIKSKEE